MKMSEKDSISVQRWTSTDPRLASGRLNRQPQAGSDNARGSPQFPRTGMRHARGKVSDPYQGNLAPNQRILRSGRVYDTSTLLPQSIHQGSSCCSLPGAAISSRSLFLNELPFPEFIPPAVERAVVTAVGDEDNSIFHDDEEPLLSLSPSFFEVNSPYTSSDSVSEQGSNRERIPFESSEGDSEPISQEADDLREAELDSNLYEIEIGNSIRPVCGQQDVYEVVQDALDNIQESVAEGPQNNDDEVYLDDFEIQIGNSIRLNEQNAYVVVQEDANDVALEVVEGIQEEVEDNLDDNQSDVFELEISIGIENDSILSRGDSEADNLDDSVDPDLDNTIAHILNQSLPAVDLVTVESSTLEEVAVGEDQMVGQDNSSGVVKDFCGEKMSQESNHSCSNSPAQEVSNAASDGVNLETCAASGDDNPEKSADELYMKEAIRKLPIKWPAVHEKKKWELLDSAVGKELPKSASVSEKLAKLEHWVYTIGAKLFGVVESKGRSDFNRSRRAKECIRLVAEKNSLLNQWKLQAAKKSAMGLLCFFLMSDSN